MPTPAPPDWASLLLALHRRIQSQAISPDSSAGFFRFPTLADWQSPAAPAEGYSAMPAPTEMSPEKWQAAMRYWQALGALQTAWLEVGVRSWERIQRDLADEPSEILLRELYDRWVESGEASFAERARSKDYADLVAELINAQVDVHLSFGIGNAPEPIDPQDLKDALAEAKAREQALRAELEKMKGASSKAASKKKPERSASAPANKKPKSKTSTKAGSSRKKKPAPSKKGRER